MTAHRILAVATGLRRWVMANRLRSVSIGGVILLVIAASVGLPTYSPSEHATTAKQQESPIEPKKPVGNCVGNGFGDRQRNVGEQVSNGKIAFVRENDSVPSPYYDIYVIDENGTDETLLTDDPSADESPVWSPGGEKIAFVRFASGGQSTIYPTNANSTIYTINADGTDQTRLTDDSVDSDGPAWSPDGEKIAFVSGEKENIYVMDADGANETRLTSVDLRQNESISRGAPQWSPDGKRIAFASSTLAETDIGSSGDAATAEGSSSPGEATGIYLVDADGTGLCMLTDTGYEGGAANATPAWSPTGEKIAFYDTAAIYVMDVDGTNRTRLTSVPPRQNADYWVGAPPVWSPDGMKIAIMKHADLYVIDADGTELERLTDTSGQIETFPTWSPDGTKLAFVSIVESPEGSRADLLVMGADGTDGTRIARDIGSGTSLSWGKG